MIERAVFSYFNPNNSFLNRSGYLEFEDFLHSMALAVVTASRHFPQVQVVSSSWGVDMFRQLELPVTEYSTEFDALQHVPLAFWAYGKLTAYAMQTQPFVHIDNDVFLWKSLPQRLLEAELCFQSKEFFHAPGYHYYNMLRPCWKAAPVRPQIIVDNEVTDFAYNCGICGGHRLEFFREWQRCSVQYLFAPENQSLFFRRYQAVLQHQNLFHEQYFAASLVKAHQLRDRVEVIADDVPDIREATANGYTHIWGQTKADVWIALKIKKRLQKESPSTARHIDEFVKDNKVHANQ